MTPIPTDLPPLDPPPALPPRTGMAVSFPWPGSLCETRIRTFVSFFRPYALWLGLGLFARRNLRALERLDLQHTPIDLKIPGNNNALTIIFAPVFAEDDQRKIMVRVRSVVAKGGASLDVGEIVAVGSFDLAQNKASDVLDGVKTRHCVGAGRRFDSVGCRDLGEIRLRTIGDLCTGEGRSSRVRQGRVVTDRDLVDIPGIRQELGQYPARLVVVAHHIHPA